MRKADWNQLHSPLYIVVMLLLVFSFSDGFDAFSGRRKRGYRHSVEEWNIVSASKSSLQQATSSSSENNENAELVASLQRQKNQTLSSALVSNTNNATSTANATTDNPAALALQQQAAKLRAEIAVIQADLQAKQEAKRQKEIADIDRWIQECLYVPVAGGDDGLPVELLNSVDTAAQVLRDHRFSHEQVSKMFDRICDTSPAQSRSNCSPLLALLVDAAGKLDCVERQDNPNKRWDGRVERDLRKRLFAMDWGFDLEPTHKGDDRFL
ncbi:expressed unknown protein [Seminavis robusta]|uniref:Uncharacterized protein n=1 Tax=Seminavis robusta TaxID=568900 RepID=A0A9N8I0L7_9STRA|nr:expressed unknown protein [Seminavis robusta]|eukprot:Sro2764_g336620.1 n/a (268) ;mRNA; f:9173-9976